MQKIYKLNNLKETNLLAKKFASSLNGGEIVLLQGDLGAGKTTFVKMILKALGYNGIVNSPTFTIMQQYIARRFKVYHFDMYRIENVNETQNFGFEEYIFNSDINSLVFIEWPENIAKVLKGHFVVVKIGKVSDTQREFSFSYEQL